MWLYMGSLLVHQWEAKFQLEVSENKIVIFFSHPSLRIPRNLSTDPQGVHGLQVKNH